MKVINGAQNHAFVMIDQIDEATEKQIKTFTDHRAFHGARIAVMPDCHAGKGAVVGMTIRGASCIVPNVIGVDIGCGMLATKITPFTKVNWTAFDKYVKQVIPAGFKVNPREAPIIPPSIGVAQYTNLRRDVVEACDRLEMPVVRILNALGSLGGGNHFIEAGVCSDGLYAGLWLTIHTGSRNFGKRIAEYHQGVAKNVMKQWSIDCPKDLEYLPVNSEAGQSYLRDMRVAQRYAAMNRALIAARLTEWLGVADMQIECAHNYVDDTGVIRKGATPAKTGQLSVIPFNMRDGLAICRGKGASDWNFSAPHGAGRILSRSAARRELSVEEFQAQMDGICTSTATAETIDEAPGAYKPMGLILSAIKETADVEGMVKPVYNFKAAEK